MNHEEDYEFDQDIDEEVVVDELELEEDEKSVIEDSDEEIDLDSELASDEEEEEEDSDEEEESDEEKKEDADEEPVEEEEEPDEEEEADDGDDGDYGDDSEEGGLGLKDIIGDDSVKPTRRRYIRIQRYCKSLSETKPRKRVQAAISRDKASTILSRWTTENNAKMFGGFIKSKEDLFQLCGKMITKEYSNKELFVEIKNGVKEWDSKIYEKQRKADDREIEIATTEMKVEKGLYTCGRCKSEKTFSRQVQTRSADEGMTSIIQCANCGKVWREYA
jgi:DNA-directed RNA polymerase subunit M/transcription elongation factor TFIIS